MDSCGCPDTISSGHPLLSGHCQSPKITSLKDGTLYFYLLLRIPSAHIEILGFPMGGAY